LSKREKRLLKIRQNLTNVSFDDAKQLLLDYGFEHKRSEGSHQFFKYNKYGLKIDINIPFRRPIKEVYAKDVVKAIDRIIAEEKNHE